MSKAIEFETLDDVSVQEILDDRSGVVSVVNISGTFNEDGVALERYGLECEDEIDLCDILNLSFDQPVICERRDVENAISSSEYLTLKVSDDRRGEEVRHLQKKEETLMALLSFKDKEIVKLNLKLKPWWKKIPGPFSAGVK